MLSPACAESRGALFVPRPRYPARVRQALPRPVPAVDEALERALAVWREELDAARRAAQRTAERLPCLEALAEAWRSSRVRGA